MTLIEILTVIGMLAILAVLSVPLYRAIIPNIELNNMYKEAIAQLREAQFRAMETQINQQIELYGVSVTFKADGTPDSEKNIIINHESETKIIEITSDGYIK